MQSLSKDSAGRTLSCGASGQFRRRWLHGSLRQASIRTPAMTEGTNCMQKEGDAFTVGEVLLEVESDVLEPLDLQDHNHFVTVSSPSSSSTPMADRTSFSATYITNVLLPLGPFVSPFFSPLTPTWTPRTPSSCVEKHSIGYWSKIPSAKLSSRLRPALLDLEFSSYPISPRFPPSAAVPSPFRMQLQEDVATTPLPSGTPLTARWPEGLFRTTTVTVAT